MKRRTSQAAALILAALLLTSCAPLDKTITTGVVTTPTAAPGETPLPPGVTVKGVVNNGRGTYLQTSIGDDNPAMRFTTDRADAATNAKYSPEMLQKAQQLVVRFIAEEAIDSTINGGGDAAAWWTVHEGIFHPATKAHIRTDLLAGKNVVQRELWQQEKYKGAYDYIYDAGLTRIKARSIKPYSLRLTKVGDLDAVRIYVDVTCAMAVTPKVGKTGGGTQYTVGPMIYDVALDAAGAWKIAGYENGTKTSEG